MRVIENKHSTEIGQARMTYLHGECSYIRTGYTEEEEEEEDEEEEIQRRSSACSQ